MRLCEDPYGSFYADINVHIVTVLYKQVLLFLAGLHPFPIFRTLAVASSTSYSVPAHSLSWTDEVIEHVMQWLRLWQMPFYIVV